MGRTRFFLEIDFFLLSTASALAHGSQQLPYANEEKF